MSLRDLSQNQAHYLSRVSNKDREPETRHPLSEGAKGKGGLIATDKR